MLGIFFHPGSRSFFQSIQPVNTGVCVFGLYLGFFFVSNFFLVKFFLQKYITNEWMNLKTVVNVTLRSWIALLLLLLLLCYTFETFEKVHQQQWIEWSSSSLWNTYTHTKKNFFVSFSTLDCSIFFLFENYFDFFWLLIVCVCVSLKWRSYVSWDLSVFFETITQLPNKHSRVWLSFSECK